VITNADTVVNPGTVVVKPFNATVADGAVAAATRADSLTVGAQLGAVNDLQEVKEIILGVFEVAWIRDHSEGQHQNTENNDCNVATDLPVA
jgi:hypothetical protein